ALAATETMLIVSWAITLQSSVHQTCNKALPLAVGWEKLTCQHGPPATVLPGYVIPLEVMEPETLLLRAPLIVPDAVIGIVTLAPGEGALMAIEPPKPPSPFLFAL